ncbi:MAG TPA: chemotaxis protein CheW [Terriglobales bacterium]|nr:chemotaxis protein CheW [Terriglobales bacterium]
MSSDLHIVGFRVGAETFGVPITCVHEIVRVPEITSVPDSPEFVEGVINLRGKIVSVVDLRKRFGEQHTSTDKKNRVIVVDSEGKLVGLIVDSASEVMRIPHSEIEPPPRVMKDESETYVTGVGKLKNRLIILVDLQRVLKRGELQKASTIAENMAVQ